MSEEFENEVTCEIKRLKAVDRGFLRELETLNERMKEIEKRMFKK